MEPHNQIKKLPFMDKVDDSILLAMTDLAEIVTLKKDEHLIKQFEIGQYLFFLLSGELTTTIPLRNQGKNYEVGTINQLYAAVGWSAFRFPSRYATTFTATKKTQLLRFPLQSLKTVINNNPDFGNNFLSYVYHSSLPILEAIQNQTQPFFANESLAFEETRPLIEKQFLPLTQKDANQEINDATFFEEFTLVEKKLFSQHVKMMLVSQGDIISQQDKESDGLYMLLRGKVVVSYQTDKGKIITTRTIVRRGTILSWSTLGGSIKNRASIISSRDSTILHIGKDDLTKVLQDNPQLSHKYWYRLIWLTGAHLLASRMRYLSQITGDEVLAVGNVVEQNAALLPVSSSLYKVSELLKSSITTNDAFGILYTCLHFGSKLERTISGMCLDILKDVQRENGFYQHLQNAYDYITHLPAETPVIDVARAGAQLFEKSYEKVPYVIKGLENLPKQAGCLFIYNHLISAENTLLPNGFRFPMDAQFIGSMIINKQYGISGTRVVSHSKKEEYWRDDYYRRFGHLFVNNWDTLSEDDVDYQHFIEQASKVLKNNTPLLIAPEGAMFNTESSPGPFRSAAFELAQHLEHDAEPWIVPIAVANFDKRVDHSIYSVVIKPAFKLSSRVKKDDDKSMRQFLLDYQTEFRGYVEEAVTLANDIRQAPYLSSQAGYRSNIRKLNQLEAEFESDVRALEAKINHSEVKTNPVVFYGSSSLSLWNEIHTDLAKSDIVNLGFSGATVDACIYYFERLVVPQKPKSIVLYTGDNDLGNRKSSNKVIDKYISLLQKIDQHFQNIPVAIISIKPSPARRGVIKEMETANEMLKQVAKTRPNTEFIDFYHFVVEDALQPNPSLFANDSLHLNERGYKKLSQCILLQDKFIFY